MNRKSKKKENFLFIKKFYLKSIRSTYEFSDLQILDENVLKLTPDRLLSMDIHPRSDIVAIIGCDRKGTVGLVVKVNQNIFQNKIKEKKKTDVGICFFLLE